MARLASVRQVWTFVFGYLLAIIAVAVGPGFASRALETHPQAGVGFAIGWVLLGALSLLPLIALVFWMYQRSDEYERHGLLRTSAIAFAMSLVVVAALDMLSQTNLLSAIVSAPRWWVLVLCWMASMLIVHLMRRRMQ
jgi:hypothetical protein